MRAFSDEGKQLRDEIAKLRPGKRRRYPVALRRRILDWVERAIADGAYAVECEKRLGVPLTRFANWREIEARPPKALPPPRPSDSMALVELVVPSDPTIAGITLVSPNGYRVEGLGLDQLVMLLKELT